MWEAGDCLRDACQDKVKKACAADEVMTLLVDEDVKDG